MGNNASQEQQKQPPPPPQKQQQQKKGGGQQQQQQQQQQQKKKGRGAGSGRGAASTEQEPQKQSKGKGSTVASGSRATDDQPAQPPQRGPSQQPKSEASAQSPQKAAQKKAQKTPAPAEPTEPQPIPQTKQAKKKGAGGAAVAESPAESTPPKQVQEPPVKDSGSSQPTPEAKAAGKGRGKKIAAKQSESAKAAAASTPPPETPEVETPVKEPPAPQPEPAKPAGKGRGKKGANVDKPSEPLKAETPEPSKPAPKPAPSQEPSKPAKSAPKSAPSPAPEPVAPAVSFQEKASKDPPLPAPAKPAGKGKGKKGASAGAGAGDSKPAGFSKATSPAQDSPKQPPKPSVAFSGPQLLIPRRPQGQCITRRAPLFEKKLIIEVNYLPINFKDFNLKIFHYDVEFNPDRPKNLYRPALRMLLDKYVPRRHPAFDGKKNMYAGGTKLEFPNGESVQDTVEVFDPERGKETEFEITVKLVAQNLSLSKLAEYLKSGTSLSIPQDVIQGVDIALRNAPIMNPNFVPVGRSFFAIPKPDSQPTDLGNGFELWHGHYQSAIMSWKPYLNVDVANKAFPIAQSVINYIYNDMKEDPEKQLEQRAEYRLLRFLKGLKVDYKIQSNDPSGFTKRTYKVKDLGAPPNRHRFKPEKEGSREITVEQYFTDVKKINLKFPHLPTIVTSNQNFLPIEFCHISPNQAVMRKLDEKQTAQMVRSAAKGTDIRRDRIFGTIGQSGFNNDPCAKEFGISLSTNFEKVEAHILKAPLIRYANGNVPVRNGVWQTRGGEKFINSPGLVSWVIINTDRKIGPQQINNLVKNFKQVGDNIGIPVQEPKEILNVGGAIRSEADFEREFRKFDKGTQILVVIMAPFGIDDIYSKIKRVAELKVGVLTQCLKAATCDFRKMNAMTAQNILLKINSKISGVNHSLAQSVLPTILREPVMIVGADVTHPAPGTDGLSIAAVAASHDSYAFKYNMLYKLQPGRQEMIERLQEMIEEQLRFFYQNCKCKPKRILYYRDGVSEGQFLQVLNIELRSIRAACKKLEDGYEPAVTFLVVQKRHHTRFFPTGPKDWDGEKNKNVMAGTLVDCTITHPTEVDFYLVSHQSIQGTARPTKYHLLWDDNKIDQDELEQLTYYLCHMFARCNRSVSYPAPTYYAHLAAFRARAWWDGQRYDASNLTKEQETKGRIQDHIVKNAPMFFV